MAILRIMATVRVVKTEPQNTNEQSAANSKGKTIVHASKTGSPTSVGRPKVKTRKQAVAAALRKARRVGAVIPAIQASR